MDTTGIYNKRPFIAVKLCNVPFKYFNIINLYLFDKRKVIFSNKNLTIGNLFFYNNSYKNHDDENSPMVSQSIAELFAVIIQWFA